MAGMLSPGDSLCQGRYEVQRLLAQGGMGNVYLAEDTRFGNRVALKENLDATPEAQRQFQFEAKVLATLRHPCLPRVFDHFTEPSGKQYLVMDFIEGDDLQELLDKRGPLPENQVLEWMREVCSALQYMHEQQPHPVIHRDIKPANIKLKPDGQVMLVDFGIAKAHMPGKKTVAGARGVTPGYSPPEQYGIGTDARSDIYALGATMYHLLTGQVPEESIMVSPTKPLVPPRQLNPTISPGMEQIILKAMALKADQRYLSTQGNGTGTNRPPVVPYAITHTAGHCLSYLRGKQPRGSAVLSGLWRFFSRRGGPWFRRRSVPDLWCKQPCRRAILHLLRQPDARCDPSLSIPEERLSRLRSDDGPQRNLLFELRVLVWSTACCPSAAGATANQPRGASSAASSGA